jgi:uncharacterized protein YndB with AHSA1/START domain
MADKKQIQLEYIINCSPPVLFNRLSTAAGLTEWFADDVRVKGNLFSFVWDKTIMKAEKKIHHENKLVRFEWKEDDSDPEDSYFEFIVDQLDLTKEVSLTVIDFAEEDELDEIKTLWDSQIAKLKHMLGS